jgi:hypothetical protein
MHIPYSLIYVRVVLWKVEVCRVWIQIRHYGKILVFECEIDDLLFGRRTEKCWRLKGPFIGHYVYYDRIFYE